MPSYQYVNSHYWDKGSLSSFLINSLRGVTHKWTSIGSDNGLSPGRRQAIIWTNAGILFIGPLGTNFSEILIEIHTFSFKKMHLKMSSGKWWPFCLGLNVLIAILISRVSCQKGPTRQAYAWQIGPFWQDTLNMWKDCLDLKHIPGSS